MSINITFRHAEASESLKAHATEKVLSLSKYIDGVVDSNIIFTKEKIRCTAEVTMLANGVRVNAKYESGDFHSAIDGVVAKVERQIVRHKEKLKRHKPISNKERRQMRESVYEYASFEEEASPKVIETGHYETTPMSIDHAVMELDLSGSPFLVFTDEEGAVKVIYHREDGDYGLIEPT